MLLMNPGFLSSSQPSLFLAFFSSLSPLSFSLSLCLTRSHSHSHSLSQLPLFTLIDFLLSNECSSHPFQTVLRVLKRLPSTLLFIMHRLQHVRDFDLVMVCVRVSECVWVVCV